MKSIDLVCSVSDTHSRFQSVGGSPASAMASCRNIVEVADVQGTSHNARRSTLNIFFVADCMRRKRMNEYMRFLTGRDDRATPVSHDLHGNRPL